MIRSVSWEYWGQISLSNSMTGLSGIEAMSFSAASRVFSLFSPKSSFGRSMPSSCSRLKTKLVNAVHGARLVLPSFSASFAVYYSVRQCQ